MTLPTELVESLNQTYFLHLLVNDKDKVVPPGKSVLSMLMHANFRLRQEEPDKHPDLIQRVTEAAHKAFWREAAEVLSSPMPFVQLPRLKRLYLDLHEALEPLFPPSYRILVTLAAPPPPTSSPLLSTVNLLKEVLIALRGRSAPIRDEQIDSLLSTTSFPPTTMQRPSTTSSQTSLSNISEPQISPFAQFVIDNIRAVLSLADEMKSDLNNFILGSMTGEQLIDVLSTELVSREREFILDLYRKEEIRDLWLSWSRETCRQNKASDSSNYRWIDRLFKALEADKPVVPVPLDHISTSQAMTNNLPPQLFFVIPALVYLQNSLQAVIITAALQILARPPHPTTKSSITPVSLASPSNDGNLRRDFVQHIWTLLKVEIDADSIDNPSFDGRPTTASNNIPETKLVNLADEVVYTRRASCAGLLKPDEEKQLRDAVDRTLRTNDPVFLVLRKRLFDALEDKLLAAIGKTDPGPSTRSSIPERMQTGSRKQLIGIAAARESSPLDLRVKAMSGGEKANVLGFEHPVLRNAIGEAYERLVQCIVWTEWVWGNDLKNE